MAENSEQLLPKFDFDQFVERVADGLVDRLSRKTALVSKGSEGTQSNGYITRHELCRRYGITLATLSKIQKAGIIPCYRFGDRRVLYKVAEVEAYVQAQRFK